MRPKLVRDVDLAPEMDGDAAARMCDGAAGDVAQMAEHRRHDDVAARLKARAFAPTSKRFGRPLMRGGARHVPIGPRELRVAAQDNMRGVGGVGGKKT